MQASGFRACRDLASGHTRARHMQYDMHITGATYWDSRPRQRQLLKFAKSREHDLDGRQVCPQHCGTMSTSQNSKTLCGSLTDTSPQDSVAGPSWSSARVRSRTLGGSRAGFSGGGYSRDRRGSLWAGLGAGTPDILNPKTPNPKP